MLEPIVILNSVVANGVGNSIFVKDFDTIVISVATSGLVSGKTFYLKGKCSIEENSPTFSAAKSITNIYDYVGLIKFPDGTPIDGESGDLFASDADDVRMYQVNVDGINWFTLDVSELPDDSITVLGKLVGYNNKK